MSRMRELKLSRFDISKEIRKYIERVPFGSIVASSPSSYPNPEIPCIQLEWSKFIFFQLELGSEDGIKYLKLSPWFTRVVAYDILALSLEDAQSSKYWFGANEMLGKLHFEKSKTLSDNDQSFMDTVCIPELCSSIQSGVSPSWS
tara:strand:- start:422 stop:856 length:435 start_codon:yes stop_codon:yes gene_type:complete